MSSFDQFSELGEGECAVLCTEADTGIVLFLEGAWALGQASRYRTHSTIDLALACANELSSTNPSWDVVVLDRRGTPVKVYRGMSTNHALHPSAHSRLRRLL